LLERGEIPKVKDIDRRGFAVVFAGQKKRSGKMPYKMVEPKVAVVPLNDLESSKWKSDSTS
jgi:hypothetical protein